MPTCCILQVELLLVTTVFARAFDPVCDFETLFLRSETARLFGTRPGLTLGVDSKQHSLKRDMHSSQFV